jgi:hypothetical protein
MTKNIVVYSQLTGGGRSARGIRNCRYNARGSFAQLFLHAEDRGAKIHAILRACQPRCFRI